MESDTLARRLGTTTHVSPLLMKAKRLGLHTAEDLERLAIQRGCRYYDVYRDSSVVREDSPLQKRWPSVAEFPNEELALSLLSICLPQALQRLRVGAAMLAAEGTSPAKLARLAIMERCELTVRYIALCGQKVEPANPFWQELLNLLPDLPMPLPDVLPHITRFAAMNGFTRKGAEITMQWIRPSRLSAA